MILPSHAIRSYIIHDCASILFLGYGHFLVGRSRMFNSRFFYCISSCVHTFLALSMFLLFMYTALLSVASISLNWPHDMYMYICSAFFSLLLALYLLIHAVDQDCSTFCVWCGQLWKNSVNMQLST